MNRITIYVTILSIWSGLFFQGCRPGKLNQDAYIQWVEDPDNGLQMVREMGNYRLIARLLPEDYWEIKQGNISSSESEESKVYYFQLRIIPNDEQETVMKAGITTEDDFQKRLKYFKYGMQNDLFLVQGKDSLKSVLYHYEQSFGLTPFTTTLIAFEDKKGYSGGQALVFDDQNLGIGPVKFSFSQAVLSHIPQLIP